MKIRLLNFVIVLCFHLLITPDSTENTQNAGLHTPIQILPGGRGNIQNPCLLNTVRWQNALIHVPGCLILRKGKLSGNKHVYDPLITTDSEVIVNHSRYKIIETDNHGTKLFIVERITRNGRSVQEFVSYDLRNACQYLKTFNRFHAQSPK